MAAAIAVAEVQRIPLSDRGPKATVIARPPCGGRFSPTGADDALSGLIQQAVQPHRSHTAGGEAVPRLVPSEDRWNHRKPFPPRPPAPKLPP
jgi:hypothetical protein